MTWIALLRAVNVAGRNSVAMSALREAMENAGLKNVRTLLQSGNALFESRATSGSVLETRLEAAAHTRFGFQIDFMVRSSADWERAVSANPFAEAATKDPGHLVLLCLKKAPHAADVRRLEAAITGREKVAVKGADLFAVYPDGIGRSKLTTALVERTLDTRCTGRNWNTVLKLRDLAKE